MWSPDLAPPGVLVFAEVGPTWSVTSGPNSPTTIGLFKTELVKPRGPWRTPEQVEIAVLEWVDWYNHRRLHEHCGDIPPVELEAVHYRQQPDLAGAGSSTN